MMIRPFPHKWICFLGCFAMLAAGLVSKSHAQIERRTVSPVTDVSLSFLLSQPPGLLVTATGEVPSGGFTDIRLERVQFVTPPADGYQIYQFSAKPPEGPATTAVVNVSASNTWPFFERDAPWIRGIRVLGEGDGIKEVPLGRRVRRNIRNYSEADLKQLRDAIQVMKDRPASDPTSWAFQANIHGAFSAHPLFNQCQHNSEHFLSWHRLYLHFFEKILRDASGDPQFTLPYWDWTNDRALPSPFREPAMTTNSLYDPTRLINQGELLPGSVVSDELNSSLAQIEFQGLFGFNRSLERDPHNDIHVLVGGNMTNPITAARDPIFWLHHCNIDRQWDVWLNSGSGRANPTHPSFLNRTFTFADSDGSTVTVRVGDMLFSSQLGYSYDTTPQPNITPESPGFEMVAAHGDAHEPAGHGGTIDVRPHAAAAHGAAGAGHNSGGDKMLKGFKTIATSKAAGVGDIAPDATPGTAPVGGGGATTFLSLDPHRVQLKMAAAAAPALEGVARAAAKTSQVLVHISDIEFEDSPSFTYAAYLNLPENVKDADRMALYRLGTLNLFGVPKKDAAAAVAAGAHEHKLSDTFDATKTISRLKNLGLWKEDKMEVVLLPVTATPTPDKAEAYRKTIKEAAEKAKVRYGEIKILAK